VSTVSFKARIMSEMACPKPYDRHTKRTHTPGIFTRSTRLRVAAYSSLLPARGTRATSRGRMAPIFEKIIAGEIPSTIVHRDERVTAFRDISPQAPVHVLIIPNKPIPTVNDVSEEDE